MLIEINKCDIIEWISSDININDTRLEIECLINNVSGDEFTEFKITECKWEIESDDKNLYKITYNAILEIENEEHFNMFLEVSEEVEVNVSFIYNGNRVPYLDIEADPIWL